ncbi:DNA (cytosine-5-)-methyltransferase [Selenomonas ruminantium]|uniref:Cytosine-specific methyltransferase n=1 Tax=Selenomonas ruminantium TaxID=971 RepID=A0A1K1M668_SELRU|nr:DNA (cytosine-5-)-methyltransferase [Selenomonas ruminantium]SFW18624.1 DNA (cytosine-5)-methyltransferase 1 [Selenomonas ruminantium]
MPRKKIRYAEFCAGVGGFRLGIEKSNLKAEPVYTNEIDDSCEKTYQKNFGVKFDSKDVFYTDIKKMPDFDMLCAGFPCQPFSVAGKERGFSDSRGTVFFRLLTIIKRKKPEIIFLENVPNLIRHDKGNTFKVIIDSLDRAGYVLSTKVLDSSYFGVPQSRSRIYIIGFLRSKYGDLKLNFTEGITEKTPLRPYLISGDYSIPITRRWNEYIDYYLGYKKEEDMSFVVPRTRKKLERIAQGCNLEDCIFQVRSSGVRALSLDSPLPTFTVLNSGGGAHIPILSKERRHISINEMKRIMGFQDDYDFSAVSRTDAAKQLANAVCPPVIASICNDIAKTIKLGEK